METSAAQHRAEGVRAGAELLGDIVRDVEHALVVLREGRGENFVADLRAVQIKLGEAEAGVADGGAFDFLLAGEFLPQPARGLTTMY